MRRTVVAFAALVATVWVAACKDEGGPVSDRGRDGPDDGGLQFPELTTLPDAARYVTVTPVDPQITVETGKGVPTVQFEARVGGGPVPAKWSLDRGELGTISSSGLLTPSGAVGGKAKVTAVVGSATGSTTVSVLLKVQQNGATQQNGNPGPGGFGGVGGSSAGSA